jgi:hypothetical protein
MASTSDHPAIRPDPDPTFLTTAALLREVANAKELVFTKIVCLEKELGDLHANVHQIPTQRAIDIAASEKLVDSKFANIEEKFNGVRTQFQERDTRVDQTARASKEALDAALQAAKEAVGKQNDSFVTSIAKSEAATAKQIDQLVLLQNASAASTNDKIEDLKTRLSAFEGRGMGRSDIWGYVLAAVGLVATLVSVIYYAGHLGH